MNDTSQGARSVQRGIRGWHLTILALLVMSQLFVAASAWAQSPHYELHIEEPTLKGALRALAQQTGHRLLYPDELTGIEGIPPLHGTWTVAAALQRLLSRTGFSGQVTDGGVITISASTTTLEGNDMTHRSETRAGWYAGAQRWWRRLATGWVAVTVATPVALPVRADTALEEVTVTAQKYAQTIQDVPLSITAYSGEELQQKGIANLTDVQGRIPGVALQSIGNAVNIQIRGVGSVTATIGSDSTAAVNVDGVYRARNFSASNLLFDVARVEVLRGPQGTLYGRNATTGALNVVSNAPSDRDEASAGIEVGNFSLMRFSGMVNTPLSDTLKLRIAGQSVKRSGYLSNGKSDADDGAARVRLLWEPIEKLSLLATADFSHKGGQGSGYVVLPTITNAAGVTTNNATNPAVNAFFSNTSSDPWFNHWDRDAIDLSEWGATFELNYDLGWADAFAQPAFRGFKLYINGPAAGQPLGAYQTRDIDQSSFEARLSSKPSAPIKWIGGVYYFNEDYASAEARTETTLTTLGPNGENRRRSVTLTAPQASAYAVFGQVTVPVLPSLRVTAGARYTKDKRSTDGYGYSYLINTNSGVSYNLKPFDAGVEAPGPVRTPGTANFSHVDWKGGVEYDINNDIMLYASASTGYKAGGINSIVEPAPATSPRTFDEEELTEYMGGMKSTWLGGSLIVNVQGYYWDYQGRQQVARSVSGPNGLTANLNYNLGGVKIYGAELEMYWRPTTQDRINLQVARNKGKYSNEDANRVVAITVTDLRGRDLAFQAPWQIMADYEHTFSLASGAAIKASLQAQWRNTRSADSAGRVMQDTDTKEDVTVRYESANGHWNVGAWCRNITNEAVISSAINSNTVATPLTTSPFLAVMEPPRTYGMNLGIRF